jgi:ABC-type multidrug transport system fused ATPase/permease subunit
MILSVPKSMNLSYTEHELAENSNQHIQDKVSNLFNIYVSGTEKYEIEEYNKVETNLENATYNNYTFNTLLSSSLQALSVIIFATTFYIIYTQYDIKEASSYILLIIVVSYFSGYLTRISSNLIGVADILGYMEKSNAFFNEIEPKHNQVNNTNENIVINGPIEFKNASFKYPDSDHLILQDINLFIKPNSKIAILGKSGTGKTTLIKLLLGFYELNNGNIYLNNIDIKEINIETLRKNIAVVTQNIKLFDKSLLENIIYGTNASEDDAVNLIKRFNI